MAKPSSRAFEQFMVKATQSAPVRADIDTAIRTLADFITTLDAGGRRMAGGLLQGLSEFPDPDSAARLIAVFMVLVEHPVAGGSKHG